MAAASPAIVALASFAAVAAFALVAAFAAVFSVSTAAVVQLEQSHRHLFSVVVAVVVRIAAVVVR